MGLKEYEHNGATWQFEEGQQPKGAKPIERTASKARTPQNKQQTPTNKASAPNQGA